MWWVLSAARRGTQDPLLVRRAAVLQADLGGCRDSRGQRVGVIADRCHHADTDRACRADLVMKVGRRATALVNAATALANLPGSLCRRRQDARNRRATLYCKEKVYGSIP
jgi:hypothetical protein